MDRKVLGRGLDALIASDPNAASSKEKVVNLKPEQVTTSRFQPRQVFDEQKIAELSASIREKGVIQPLIVRQVNETSYELIAGERRFRAAKLAGLNEVPAIVRKVSDADVLEMSIIENVQREELNAIEEAQAYRRLASEFNLSQDEIAKKVGKDKSSVSNLLRVLNLPENIQEHVFNGHISFGHAKALLSLQDAQAQNAFCQKAIKNSMSVRQLESLISSKLNPKRSAQRVAAAKDVDIVALEKKIEHRLGTKVKIRHGRKRGKIEIEYYSLNDLDRVLKILAVV